MKIYHDEQLKQLHLLGLVLYELDRLFLNSVYIL